MNKKIWIGSFFASALLLFVPIATSFQVQETEKNDLNMECEECVNEMPSQQEIQELIDAIQDFIDYLNSIGYQGALIQQLQYFIDNVTGTIAHEVMCMMLFYFVVLPLLLYIAELLEHGSEAAVVIVALVALPIFLMYESWGCTQYEFPF